MLAAVKSELKAFSGMTTRDHTRAAGSSVRPTRLDLYSMRSNRESCFHHGLWQGMEIEGEFVHASRRTDRVSGSRVVKVVGVDDGRRENAVHRALYGEESSIA